MTQEISNNSSCQPQTLLRIPEVAERLSLGRSTVYKLIQHGVLKGVVRVGRSIRIRSHAVDEFITKLPELDIAEDDSWQLASRYVEDVGRGSHGIQSSSPSFHPSPAAPHTSRRAQQWR